MNQIVLCTLHDPSNHAFFVREGKLTIKSDVFAVEKLPVKNLLVGTFELLLADSEGVPNRKFHIEVEGNARPPDVPFELVEEMFLDFDRGQAVNRFLSLLVERTNSAIKKMSAHESWRRYEDFARFLSEITEKLVEINDSFSLQTIDDVVEKLASLHIIQYGTQARTATELRPINTGKVSEGEQVFRAKPGEVLCRDGDEAEGLFVLLEGEVIVKKGERVLATLTNPGEAFGELSLFLRSKRTADAIAGENTAYLMITNEQLPAFHKEHPLLFFDMARAIAKRVQRNLDELEVMAPIISLRVDTVLGKYATEVADNFRYLKRMTEVRAITQLARELQDGIEKRL